MDDLKNAAHGGTCIKGEVGGVHHKPPEAVVNIQRLYGLPGGYSYSGRALAARAALVFCLHQEGLNTGRGVKVVGNNETDLNPASCGYIRLPGLRRSDAYAGRGHVDINGRGGIADIARQVAAPAWDRYPLPFQRHGSRGTGFDAGQGIRPDNDNFHNCIVPAGAIVRRGLPITYLRSYGVDTEPCGLIPFKVVRIVRSVILYRMLAVAGNYEGNVVNHGGAVI